MNDDDTLGAAWRVALAICGTVWGWVTLQHVVLVLTGVYTALQVYVLWRDKVRAPRPPKAVRPRWRR